MVHGLDVFREWFAEYPNRYVLRLCALFAPGTRIEMPPTIIAEIERFVRERPWDDNMMRNLGLRMSADSMAELILSSYVVSE